MDVEKHQYINLYIMDSLSCSYCLANKVFYWKEFENNMKVRNKNSHFCLIVYGNENTCNLINKVFYYTQLNVPTFVDTAMCFIKENKILDSIPKLSSMFIDKNGKVLLAEDPTANDRVMNNIYDLISQWFSQNPHEKVFIVCLYYFKYYKNGLYKSIFNRNCSILKCLF